MKRLKMRQFSILLISLFLFSGCSLVNENTDSFKFKYLHLTTTTNFTDLTEDLLEQLCPTIHSVNQDSIPMYVVDFTNLKDLENHSELGFMLSDELKTHVTQMCNIPLYAIEYTKYLKIGANGTKFFSRDLDQLNSKKVDKSSYALVGTYAFTQRQLILYLKFIDLKTGIIIKSATEKTLITDEIIHLEQQNKKQPSSPTNIYQPITL